MAIEWVNLYSDKFSLGIDWHASTNSTSVTTGVEVYRYDAQNTDNSSGKFDESMSEPDGSWGTWWNKYSFGKGQGTRRIDVFASRTYARTTYDYRITYALSCNSSTGTYYNGWHTVGAKDLTWSLTIPKLDSYTVSYDANGGSNAPSSQTKWYGTTLSLSSQKPVRANYNFLGWSTSSTATSAEYLAGGSYTSNSGATLYAVWKLAAVAPTISSATFNRCTENGEINAEGTYIKAVIAWAVDTKVVTSNAGKVINITWSPATGDVSSKSIAVTETSGTVTQILGSADFDPSTVYTFNSSITDTVGLTTSSGSRIVASVFHTFDIGNKGKSIGLGAVASDSSNSLTVGFDSTIINNDNVIINGRQIRVNKILWGFNNAAYYMTSKHIITLSESILKQPNGIILCWCIYDSSTGQPAYYDNSFSYIPKKFVELHPGVGIDCIIGGNSYTEIGYKYIYVNNLTLTGYDGNNNGFLGNFVCYGVLGV